MKVRKIIDSFYFDTYALVEIGKQNQGYERYKDNVKIALNKLNITEFCYFLTRENREKETGAEFSNLQKFHVDFVDSVYLEAVKMKYRYKERKLSYIDCLGYCMAKYLKIKFLTGDEKFRDLSNVEFAK